jgi:phosphate transport system substrate-binding protein
MGRLFTEFMVAAVFVVSIAFLQPAQGAEVDGAGSSFVAPIMTEWASAYARATGTTVNYASVGSGAGIERIRAGTVDFGATDKPLSSQDLEAAGLCQFPIVVGGVVPSSISPASRPANCDSPAHYWRTSIWER